MDGHGQFRPGILVVPDPPTSQIWGSIEWFMAIVDQFGSRRVRNKLEIPLARSI